MPTTLENNLKHQNTYTMSTASRKNAFDSYKEVILKAQISPVSVT